jgi:exopolysaccharide biosynthesis polyprenyl glycosylphosphotransferase
MTIRSSLKFTLFLLLCDVILTNVALYVAQQLRLAIELGKHLGPGGAWLYFWPILFPIVSAIWVIMFTMMGVYDRRRTLRAADDFQIVAQATVVATLVFAGVAYFFFRELSRLLFVYFFFLDLFLLFAWRIVLRLFFLVQREGWPRETRRVLIVGAGAVGYRVGEALKEHTWSGLELVGYLDDDPGKQENRHIGGPVLGSLDDVTRVVEEARVQEVVVALPLRAHQRVKDLVRALRDTGVQIRIVPDYFDLAQIKTGIEEFGGLPLVSLREPAMDEFQRMTKRIFDLILCGLGFVLAVPMMLVIAVLIKLDSAGDVLFRQERIGENGRHFHMYKFRSMVKDADRRNDEVMIRDEDGKLVYKQRDDPRVTRVGKFLRRTSLDELPQLLNVIKGEMSLVGPRPELPWVVEEEYEPWQFQRFVVPQGMTGWWQVNGRSDKPMHLHTEEDLYYIKNYSLALDVVILWKTVGAVLKRKGAY